MPADIFTLTSELHEAIAQRVHLEDLLNFSATCKQFQRTVTESSEVWEHLYSVHFKDSAYSRDVEARVAFKARCESSFQSLLADILGACGRGVKAFLSDDDVHSVYGNFRSLSLMHSASK